MKGGSNIVSGIQHLAMAYQHFESFCLEHPRTKGAMLFGGYCKKIEWIRKDLLTTNELTQDVRNGIREELASDPFTVPAIAEKIALLQPKHREMIEALIDRVLAGEELAVEFQNQ